MPVRVEEFTQSHWVTPNVSLYANYGDYDQVSNLVPTKDGRQLKRVPSWSAQVDTDGGGTGGLLFSLAVGLKAITSVLCPLMIRASIPAADWIERHLPMPAQRALSQYGVWVELIRKSPGAISIASLI